MPTTFETAYHTRQELLRAFDQEPARNLARDRQWPKLLIGCDAMLNVSTQEIGSSVEKGYPPAGNRQAV